MACGVAHAGGVVDRVVPQHGPPVEVEHGGAGAAGPRLQHDCVASRDGSMAKPVPLT